MSSVGKRFRYIARAGRKELGGTGRYGQEVTVLRWHGTKVLIQFEDGHRTVCPGRCLRKEKAGMDRARRLPDCLTSCPQTSCVYNTAGNCESPRICSGNGDSMCHRMTKKDIVSMLSKGDER